MNLLRSLQRIVDSALHSFVAMGASFGGAFASVGTFFKTLISGGK